jgi:hypothetical protein
LRGAYRSRQRAPDGKLRNEAVQSSFVVLDCFAFAAIDAFGDNFFFRLRRFRQSMQMGMAPHGLAYCQPRR